MRYRCANDQHMENLMRVAEYVELAGPQLLWDASGVDSGPQDIQKPLEKKPAKPNLLPHLAESKQVNTVYYWENGRQAHPNKHACAEGSPAGGPEPWQNRNTHAS